MASTSEPNFQSLGIDRLSVPQRMELLEEIWDSIAAEGQLPQIPQWHQDELDRRLAESESNPQAGSPWAEVKARLRKTQ